MIPNSKEQLAESLHKYNAAVRWGAMDWAVEHVAPDKRNELLARRAEFGELQVTECLVGAVKLKNKDEALAMVRVDWYLTSTLKVRTSFIEQSWRRKSGKWMITAQRLVRGAPYPLLLESPEKRRFKQQETWPKVTLK